MNFIINAIGTRGDVNPLIGLAKALRSRNHDCTILTNDRFKEDVIGYGIKFHSISTEEEFTRGNSPESWASNSKNNDNFMHYHAPSFERAFRYTEAAIQENGKLIVISIGHKNGAAEAAKKYNIPIVLITLSPNLIFSYISPPAPYCWKIPKWIPLFLKMPVLHLIRIWHLYNFSKSKWADSYQKARKELGVPFSYRLTRSADVDLAFFPGWFAMKPKDWPKNIKFVGFPLFDTPNSIHRDSIDNFINKNGAPLIFTNGTGFPDAYNFFLICREICRIMEIPGIFVGKSSPIPPLPNTQLMQIDYADFAYLLPKSKAIIHHGGIGTTAQAIRAGIPQLIRPIKYDQPDNARRIHKLKLGTFLFPESFTPERASEALTKLILDYYDYNRAAIYSEDIKSNDPFEKACHLIEKKMNEIYAHENV